MPEDRPHIYVIIRKVARYLFMKFRENPSAEFRNRQQTLEGLGESIDSTDLVVALRYLEAKGCIKKASESPTAIEAQDGIIITALIVDYIDMGMRSARVIESEEE